MIKHLIVAAALMLVAADARAQTPVPVTTSSGIGNITSPDHAALNADGTPVITKYQVRFQPVGTCGVAVPPFEAGKPGLVAGILNIQPIASFGSLTANCAYTAVVAAVGPGGEGVSLSSPPFARMVALQPATPSRPAILP